MEQLLKKSTVQLTQHVLDKQDECPISGEYNLPEYCSDISTVLKCFADPRIQNRQWSGDQLLIDGNAVVRVWYVSEDRRQLHTLEFTLPFSCVLHGDGHADHASTELELGIKYLNCRALSQRRIEVRGAVAVRAEAECAVSRNFLSASESDELHVRKETVAATVPVGACEKILSVSESLEFNHSLPPAERLLGGDCRAVLRECKILSGKVIVKGQVFVHQLYADNSKTGQTHCLDYTLPFSQILDVDGAEEGMRFKCSLQILSDTERCGVGPDGENTMLDIMVKLLIQVQVYQSNEICWLNDAFHSRFPLSKQMDEVKLYEFGGRRWEITTLPMQLALPCGCGSEIIDVVIQPQTATAECREGTAGIKGRMMVCVAVRDTDGEIVCEEFVEEYGLTYDCNSNLMRVMPTVMDWQYRVVEDKLELQAKFCMRLTEYMICKKTMITELHLDREMPYPHRKITTLLYYADAGESVWEIGRSCHASPACIMEENALHNECLDDSTLIVVPILN